MVVPDLFGQAGGPENTAMTRLEQLIHYIVAVTPPEKLGATKLAKILWFADVDFYRQTGETISHSNSYKKRDNGPLHVDFYNAIARLKQNHCIEERLAPTPVGYRKEFVWLKQPNVSGFSGQEIATLQRHIDIISKMSAKQVSDLSHVEPWNSAYDGEYLPIAAAAVQFGDVSDDDLAWAEAEFHDAVRPTA